MSEDLFQRGQNALELRRRSPHGSPRSKAYSYDLSGLFRCVRCGSPLVGHTKSASKAKGSRKYFTYACSGAKKYGKSTCAHYSIPARRMEGVVRSVVQRVLASDNALNMVRQGVKRRLDEMAQRVQDLSALEKRRQEIEATKTALFKKLNAEDRDFFKPQVDELRKEAEAVECQIASAKRAGAGKNMEKEMDEALTQYKRMITAVEEGDGASLRKVFQALGLRIDFDPDRKEGFLRFDPFGQSASRSTTPEAA